MKCMATARAAIRTPDQRLRVFVSSTLRELEPERKAARAAIELLRLAPVMFELGARPHPPRSLYRAYLDQSDVFVGLYWERYGWVAPGEEVSGLEDEYSLADPGMPKLIYIKSSDRRDDRLLQLIDRIRSDDNAAYVTFDSDEQLKELIAADLATLLAERFDESRDRHPPADMEWSTSVPDRLSSPARADPAPLDAAQPIPPTYSPLIGRERETAEVVDLLRSGADRIVTLVGPGGVGKSRLALEVLDRARHDFAGGAYFVPLENVLEPSLLLPTIAYALGVRDTGEVSVEERLAIVLADKRMLIALDNFEQILDAGPTLVRLYSIAPSASFLVTSRTVLRVRGERVYELPGLAVPDDSVEATAASAGRSAAVQLFVARAAAVHPDFVLDESNADTVARICAALQGLPLAIELAAARMRVLTPRSMLERLDKQLPLLVGAPRDAPGRQRTLRSTIEWSTNLLGERDRALLFDLSVFSLQFTLEAVEALGADRSWGGSELEGLDALIDSSLVRQHEADGHPSYSMLATVREFALEKLRASGAEAGMRAGHARHYLELARRLGPELKGAGQVDALTRLERERSNLRSAIRHLVYTGHHDEAADFAWNLLVFWWIGGFFGEVRVWMQEILDAETEPTARTWAIARFYVLWMRMWQSPDPTVVDGFERVRRVFEASGDDDAAAVVLGCTAMTRAQIENADRAKARDELERAIRLFQQSQDGWGEAVAWVTMGRFDMLDGDNDAALDHYRRGAEVSRRTNDAFAITITEHHVARLLLFQNRLEEAEPAFADAAYVSATLGHLEGAAYGIEGLCAIAALRGQAERAGLLAGAAQEMRKKSGMYDAEAFVYHPAYLQPLRTAFPDLMRDAEERGRRMPAADVMRLALPPDRQEAAAAGFSRK
jgi:predicted ATPase